MRRRPTCRRASSASSTLSPASLDYAWTPDGALTREAKVFRDAPPLHGPRQQFEQSATGRGRLWPASLRCAVSRHASQGTISARGRAPDFLRATLGQPEGLQCGERERRPLDGQSRSHRDCVNDDLPVRQGRMAGQWRHPGRDRRRGRSNEGRRGYRIVWQLLRIDLGRRNVIEITAYNGTGLLASLPYHLEIDKFGEATERPRMFMVAVGVSHYAKADWSLKYAADDAKVIGDRLRDVAMPLYAEPRVVPVLEDAATAKGIEAAIDSIAGDVRPADVFVLYIAGHGRSIAGAYYFLPQDLTFDGGRTIANAAISQDMLQTWLARIAGAEKHSDPRHLRERVCDPGRCRTKTAIDRLQHATGLSIITAASDAAHEGYQGHGLLTGPSSTR